ncbi:unnamed protein product, partial [Staurois parvus]
MLLFCSAPAWVYHELYYKNKNFLNKNIEIEKHVANAKNSQIQLYLFSSL